MIDTHRLAAFAVTAFALIVVPGPSVLFVISRAVSMGRRAALLTVAGNAAGVYLQVLLVAAGLGSIVERSIAVFTLVKILGAGYLVYLGVQSFRHRHRLAEALDVGAEVRPTRHLVRDGIVVGISNPKAIVFFAAVLPQFVNPDLGHVPAQMAVLGLVFVAIALCSDGAWGMAAGTARTWFAKDPSRLAAVGGVGGLVTIGLGIRLALLGRHD